MKLKQLEVWEDLIIRRSSKGWDKRNGKGTYRIRNNAEKAIKLLPFNIPQGENES